MALSKFVRETPDTQSSLLFSWHQKNWIRSRNRTMEVKMSWEEGVTNCSFLPCTDWPLYLVRLVSANEWAWFVVFCAVQRCYFAAISCSQWSSEQQWPFYGGPPICPLWPVASRRDFTPLTGCFLLLRLFSVNLGEAVHKTCSILFYLSNEHNYQQFKMICFPLIHVPFIGHLFPKGCLSCTQGPTFGLQWNI